ncbi:MAG: hypothetical protein ABIO70_26240 [Pseudomonadota bacterium]
MRPLRPFLTLFALACGGGTAPVSPVPPAPTPPPAPSAVPDGPLDLANVDLAWDKVTDQGGRWVRPQPCMATVGSLVFDPSGRAPITDAFGTTWFAPVAARETCPRVEDQGCPR